MLSTEPLDVAPGPGDHDGRQRPVVLVDLLAQCSPGGECPVRPPGSVGRRGVDLGRPQAAAEGQVGPQDGADRDAGRISDLDELHHVRPGLQEGNPLGELGRRPGCL